MEDYTITELEDFGLNHYIHHFDEYEEHEASLFSDDVTFDYTYEIGTDSEINLL